MKSTASTEQSQSVSLMRLALVAAFVAALGVFIVRGPLNALQTSDDFILVYSPARVWLFGGNPYDFASIDAVWEEAGGPFERRPSTRKEVSLLYPPTTLLMFAPFAVLPWKLALPVWVIANIGFLAIVLAVLARLAEFRASQYRWWIFMIAALLFAPLHTTIRVGQTPLMVMAMLALGYWCFAVGKRSDAMNSKLAAARSGLFLSFAALIKPQIAVPFIAFDVLCRRWTVVATACAVIIIAAIVSIAPLTARGVPWWSNWQANLAAFSEGSVGDPTSLNYARHQLLNLHYPLHTLIESRAIVNWMVLAIVGVLAVIGFRFWVADFGFWIAGRTRATSSATNPQSPIPNPKSKTPDLLLSISIIAVLTLMIVYHRYYDAVLLLLPLAWAIGEIASRRKLAAAWCVIVLMLPIFINASTVLKVLETRAPLPAWLLDQWWWNNLLLPMQAWSLLGMAVVMVLAATRRLKTDQMR